MSKQIWDRAFEFEVSSNVWTQVEVPAPPRGSINGFVLVQISGNLAGWQGDLYNRQDATQEVAGSESVNAGYDENSRLALAVHRVLDHFTVAASSPGVEQRNLSAGYQNMDEQDQRRVPSHKLWLDIKPNGTGTKKFHLKLTVEPFHI